MSSAADVIGALRVKNEADILFFMFFLLPKSHPFQNLFVNYIINDCAITYFI